MSKKAPARIHSKIYLVQINLMERASELITQRPFVQAHGDNIAKNLDLNLLGIPVLNHRGGKFLIIDGQHRVYAMKENGFVGLDDKIMCEVYENLTDQQMAMNFLGRAQVRGIQPFVKFMLGITAQQTRETAILRAVESNGATISRYKKAGSIMAVSALIKIYDTALDQDTAVGFVVRVAMKAWNGDPLGLDGAMLEGMGQVYARYHDEGRGINEKLLIERLSLPQNSPRHLLRRADDLRARTGRYRSQCLASILVDVYNKGTLGRARLASWWSKQEPEAS